MSNGNKPNVDVIINTTPEALKGHYSNAVKVAVTDSEVIIDFAFLYEDQSVNPKKQGVMTDRLIVNHDLANKLAQSLTNTINEHKNKQKTAK